MPGREHLTPGSMLRIVCCSALAAVGHTVFDEELDGYAFEALNAIPSSLFCRLCRAGLQMF